MDFFTLLTYIVLALLFSGGSALSKKLNKTIESQQNKRKNRESVFDESDELPTIEDIKEEIRKKILRRKGDAEPIYPTTRAETVLVEEEAFNEMVQYEEPKELPLPAINRELEAKRQAIARKRKEAAALARKQSAVSSTSEEMLYDWGDGIEGAFASPRPQLLARLKDPRALQEAFLYREILGPPVSLRE